MRSLFACARVAATSAGRTTAASRAGTTCLLSSVRFSLRNQGIPIASVRNARHSSTVVSGMDEEDPRDLPATSICRTVADLQFSVGTEEEVLAILPILTDSLKTCKDTFTLEDVVMALFGLQSISSEVEEVHDLFATLCEKLQPFKGYSWKLTQVSRVIFGLQGMNSELQSVQHLLVLLTEQVKTSQDEFTIDCFADIVCGLHSMDSEIKEVSDFIAALADKAESLSGHCEDTHIDLILHGMQLMDSDHEPVQKLIRVVNKLFASCNGILSDEGILDGLRALRLMDSSSKNALVFAQCLNTAMSRRVENSVEPIRITTSDVVDITSCLYGFSSEHTEVQELLVHVAEIFKNNLNVEEVEESDILTILEMFGSFTDKPAAVRLFLTAFKDKIESLPFMLDTDEVTDLMQDCFRNYDFMNCQEVREVVSMLHYKSRKK